MKILVSSRYLFGGPNNKDNWGTFLGVPIIRIIIFWGL